jgi:hypothetical protein
MLDGNQCKCAPPISVGHFEKVFKERVADAVILVRRFDSEVVDVKAICVRG